jgi:hypothetical protein
MSNQEFVFIICLSDLKSLGKSDLCSLILFVKFSISIFLFFSFSLNKIKENIDNTNRKIIYARVSSISQTDDLERQIELLKEKYPNYELIKDVGSGMNMNIRGLRKIIDYAIMGEIKEVVIVYKDRLTHYGYDLIEYLINKYSSREKCHIIENDLLKIYNFNKL